MKRWMPRVAKNTSLLAICSIGENTLLNRVLDLKFAGMTAFCILSFVFKWSWVGSETVLGTVCISVTLVCILVE